MTIGKRRGFLSSASGWALIGLLGAPLTQVAMAQEAPATADDQRDIVVVTAQKREEDIKDVPIAISAVTGKTLDTLRVTSLDAVATLAPNTNYKNQSPAAPSISIRGITSDESGAGSESAVSTYLDGVDISRREGAQIAIYDMERIEIARGPQGTLFGTASEIGGLSLITHKPEDTFEAAVTTAVGNLDYRKIDGMVNLPISDWAALRISGLHEERQGYIENRGGTVGDASHYMGIDTDAARVSLLLTPSDQLKITLIGYHEQNNPTGTQFTSFNVPNQQLQLADYYRETYQAPRKPSKFSREITGGIALVDAEINDGLSFSSITGYREYNYQQYFDLDGASIKLVDSDIDNSTWSLYQEARINFELGDNFRSFAGVSYIHESVAETIGLTFSEPIFAVLRSGVFVLPNGQPNQLVLPASMAAFGIALDPDRREYREQGGRKIDTSAFIDMTYDINEQLSVSGGVRYVRNDRRFLSNQPAVGQSGLIRLGVFNAVSAAITSNLQRVDATFNPSNQAHRLFGTYISSLMAALPNAYASAPKNLIFTATNGLLDGDASFHNTLPRLSFTYRATDDITAYAGIAKGQRSGFLQTDGAGAVSKIDPEKLWNYEVGLKGAFNDFSFDSALFFYDWTDFQTVELIDPTNPSLGQRSVNAGSATAWGVEISGVYEPIDGVSFFTALSYLDASFDKFLSSEGDFSGHRFRISPEWQGTIGVNVEQPLTDDLTGILSARARYQSEVFFDNENVAPKMDGANTIVNANIGVRSKNGGWTFRLFADNLLDEKYLLDGGNSGDQFGTPTAIAAAPRTYGAEFGITF